MICHHNENIINNRMTNIINSKRTEDEPKICKILQLMHKSTLTPFSQT